MPLQSPAKNVCGGHAVLMHGVVVVAVVVDPVVVDVVVVVVRVLVVFVVVVSVRELVVDVPVTVVVVPVPVVLVPVAVVNVAVVPVTVVLVVVVAVVLVAVVEVLRVKRTLYVVRAVNTVPRSGPTVNRPSHLRATSTEVTDASSLSLAPVPPPGVLPLSRKTPAHRGSATQRSKHAFTVSPPGGRLASVEAMLNARYLQKTF